MFLHVKGRTGRVLSKGAGVLPVMFLQARLGGFVIMQCPLTPILMSAANGTVAFNARVVLMLLLINHETVTQLHPLHATWLHNTIKEIRAS